jgi:hypothetical protein
MPDKDLQSCAELKKVGRVLGVEQKLVVLNLVVVEVLFWYCFDLLSWCWQNALFV